MTLTTKYVRAISFHIAKVWPDIQLIAGDVSMYMFFLKESTAPLFYKRRFA